MLFQTDTIINKKLTIAPDSLKVIDTLNVKKPVDSIAPKQLEKVMPADSIQTTDSLPAVNTIAKDTVVVATKTIKAEPVLVKTETKEEVKVLPKIKNYNTINSFYDTSDSVYFSFNAPLNIHKTYNKNLFNLVTTQPDKEPAFRAISKKNWYPDWGLLALFSGLILILFAQIYFNKTFAGYFKTLFNYRLSVKLLNDPSSVKKQFFTLLNANFIVMFSFFIYLYVKYYHFNFFDVVNIWLPVKTLAFTIAWLLFRYISISFISYIIREYRKFDEYVYHIFSYFKILGILFLPLNILIIYSDILSPRIWFFIGIFLFSSVYLITLHRGFKILSEKGVLIYYRILYLCTLEIMPLSVLTKFVLG